MSRKQRPAGHSGNPAKQAEQAQSIKQQREAKRQEKLAEYQRQLNKRNRGKLVWWSVGTVAAIAVIGAIAASIILTPTPNWATYTAGSQGAEIEGVETFNLSAEHVQGSVDYEQTPPAGGPHNQAWLNCGVYSEPQPNENAVHSLEHGAIWLTYDPEVIQGDDVQALQELMPREHAILSPYPGMDTPIAVSGWNTQLKVDAVTDERIGQFFEEYWRSQNVPEPNASCTGAVDGPGNEL